MKHTHNLTHKQLRLSRVRHKVRGTPERPRLHVFRSNHHLYAQLINDEKGLTLAAVSHSDLEKASGTKTARAQVLGTLIAQKAKTKKISKVAFDRGANKYHGRIKAFADAARAAGLIF
jgi:large subunit ribosomal protein L18